MAYTYRLVDVFSDTAFLGNPVAVILGADGLSAEQMLSITRWMNLSETTFVHTPVVEGADYGVRIFTLDRELPFAGHPTLGSCAAWLSSLPDENTALEFTQACKAGLIRIRRDGDRFAFAAPPLLRTGRPSDEDIAEVCDFLNISRGDIADVEWIDNGPGWLGVRLASAADVLAVQPKAQYPRRIEIGLVGPWPAGSGRDFEVRALFSDQHGAVREDPVTGSLNAAVAQWLIATGQTDGRYVAGQGQAIGRDGRIEVSADDNDVWIGGSARVIVSGRIEI
ncbi:MAG: PhzF family phenazine biosynthesis protein [Pseudomonadota bacterium]